MTTKTFIRLMFLTITVTASIMLFSASVKKSSSNDRSGECPSSREKCDKPRADGDLMIWESISNHLLSLNR